MNEVKTVAALKRLCSSRYGNPRYAITFTDGTSANTAANHGFVYEITAGLQGQDVYVTIGGRGTITDMYAVSV